MPEIRVGDITGTELKIRYGPTARETWRGIWIVVGLDGRDTIRRIGRSDPVGPVRIPSRRIDRIAFATSSDASIRACPSRVSSRFKDAGT